MSPPPIPEGLESAIETLCRHRFCGIASWRMSLDYEGTAYRYVYGDGTREIEEEELSVPEALTIASLLDELAALRDDARLGRICRQLLDAEGLAVIRAPYEEPGIVIAGCRTEAKGETLAEAVAELERVLARGGTE